MQINSRWFSQWQLCLVLKKHSLTSLIYSLLLRNRNSCLMILLHFDGEKQREIQTNFQVTQSGSRQIRKKKHLGLDCKWVWPLICLRLTTSNRTRTPSMAICWDWRRSTLHCRPNWRLRRSIYSMFTYDGVGY